MDSLAQLANELDVPPSLLNDAMRDVINDMNVEVRMENRAEDAPDPDDSPGRSGEAPGRQETPPGRGSRPNTE